jgi:hypothetical protein
MGVSCIRRSAPEINTVLGLSKIEAGKMEFHAEPVEPGKLVNEVCDVIRTLVAGHLHGVR